MPKLSIQEAAKLADVERSTLYRRYNKGEISFEIDEKGSKVIDLSELGRVYPFAAQKFATQHAQQQALQQPQQPATTFATDATTEKLLRIKELELENKAKDKEIALLEKRVEETQGRVQEVAAERDNWRDQAQKLLLTYQPSVKAPEAPSQPVATNHATGDATSEQSVIKSNAYTFGILVAIAAFVTFTLSVVMFYFQTEIRAFIDQTLLGKSAPVVDSPPVADKEITPPTEPNQSFPPPSY